jgi:hypothetical protein
MSFYSILPTFPFFNWQTPLFHDIITKEVRMDMLAETTEWLNQSEYDFETAQAMYKTKRYVYAIFMCHLALEKFLKAL